MLSSQRYCANTIECIEHASFNFLYVFSHYTDSRHASQDQRYMMIAA